MVRHATWIVIAAGGALLVALAGAAAWTTDDALITFRYVENLVAGHGLVFNPGERVEGFSNPLFALLLLPAALGGADLFQTSIVLGIVAAVVELALLVAITRRHGAAAAALAAALFATDRIVVVWSTGGLETSLQGALVTALLWALVAGRAHAAAVLAALVAIGRPEGIVFTALAVVVLARRRRLATALNIVLPVLALFVAARYLYYGELVANPFHAKMGGVPTDDVGVGYVVSFLRRLGLFALPHAAAWLFLVFAPRARAAALPGAFVLVALITIGIMGGDYMTDFRLFRPIMAPLYAAVVIVLAAAPRKLAVAAAVLLVASHAWRQLHPVPIMSDAPPPAAHKHILTVDAARAAHFRVALETFAEPGDSILADWGGFMSYGHTLRTIDATGLVSKHVRRDFYLRDARTPQGVRERLPGHARWPKIGFLLRERVTFIFPKVNRRPPDDPEVTEASSERTKSYPFLHVTVPVGGGEFLRFFTTMTADEIAARAARRGLSGVCWRKASGPLSCAP